MQSNKMNVSVLLSVRFIVACSFRVLEYCESYCATHQKRREIYSNLCPDDTGLRYCIISIIQFLFQLCELEMRPSVVTYIQPQVG